MDWNTNYYPPVRLIQLILDDSAQNNSIIERGVRVFKERIANRCAATVTPREVGFTLTLCMDSTIGTDGFRINGDEKGAVIAGNCSRAVVYGLGKYLRTSGYSAEGFHPSRWQGTSVPTSPFRGIQMDTHFCNFYHMAPEHELREYVEDVILWGINYIEFVFPLLDLRGWEDPEVERITGQICTLYATAKALGVKVGMEIVPNQDFMEQNMDIRAELCPDRPGGNTGHNICPNRPGAMDYICNYTHGRTLEHLKAHGVALDFVCFWPYDEGGCGCEACSPWGANGYLKASKAILEVVRSYMPEVEVILSTWSFDVCQNSDGLRWDGSEEWEGLTEALEEDSGWVDYILADSHGDFPRYPLEYGVPGGLPMINYPEISMYKLIPWGGYGANPLPDHFEQLWHQVKNVVRGGIAYSEGNYNDINKVLVSQFYWNKDATADEIMREYIAYEYAPIVYDEVRQAIRLIEQNHELAAHSVIGGVATAKADLETARQACILLRKADEKLDAWAKKSWRWRLLVIRAEMDLLRYTRAWEQADVIADQKHSWYNVMKGCKEIRPLMTELCQILHSNLDFNSDTPPHFAAVRPPIRGI